MSSPSPQFIFNNYSTQSNVAFINEILPLQQRENGSHAIIGIFGMSVSVLIPALQLKYQAAGTRSAFEDHPVAMGIAIASLLIFCLVFDIEQQLHTSGRNSTFATLLQHVLRLLAFMSLASLAYAIFTTSAISTTSLIIYLIFPCSFSARLVLHWIQSRNLRENRGTYNFNNLHPHMVFTHYFHRTDTLPVYGISSANLV